MKSFPNFNFLWLLFYLLFPCQQFANPDPQKLEFLASGNSAPNCTLQDLNDSPQAFPASGSWNVVFFFSLFCHTCLEEIPIIAAETEKLARQGVRSFYVSLDTSRMKKGLNNYLLRRGLQITVLLEELVASSSYLAADKWGVKITPSVFLVNPRGEILFSQEGPFDPDDLLKILHSNLSSGTSQIKSEEN